MRKIENSDDWYGGYKRDAQIALTEIEQNFSADKNKTLCDVYSLPSHNHQTFYCRVVNENGFIKLIYAKALQNSIWFSEPIYMYRFEEAKNFFDHPIRKGRIYCGKKIVQHGIADRLLNIMNALSDVQPGDLVTPTADADLTVITLYDNGTSVREISFTDAEKLAFNNEIGDGDVEYLKELHFKIEAIIGLGIG